MHELKREVEALRDKYADLEKGCYSLIDGLNRLLAELRPTGERLSEILGKLDDSSAADWWRDNGEPPEFG